MALIRGTMSVRYLDDNANEKTTSWDMGIEDTALISTLKTMADSYAAVSDDAMGTVITDIGITIHPTLAAHELSPDENIDVNQKLRFVFDNGTPRTTGIDLYGVSDTFVENEGVDPAATEIAAFADWFLTSHSGHSVVSVGFNGLVNLVSTLFSFRGLRKQTSKRRKA